MKIDLVDFGGIVPKLGKHVLPSSGASIAKNCRLGSGMMRPLARMRLDHMLPFEGGSMFRWKGKQWFHFSDAGRVFVPGLVFGDEQKLYMCKESGGITTWTEATGEVKLGCPAPSSTPIIATSGDADSDATESSVVYVYTCVNSLGEESAPSPASEVLDIQGHPVKISGMTTPAHSGYAPITLKRVYRLSVGDNSAAYLYVDEIEASITEYIDSKDDSELGEMLPSLNWQLPADDLRGLVSTPFASLAAFHGQEVRLSAPNYPYAWPEDYAYSVEFNIVGLACSGTTLFIFTDGPVYQMSVDDLSNAAPVRMEGNTPCLSKRAIIETPSGVLFPSRDGLYFVGSGVAKAYRLTGDYFDMPDWQQYRPTSMFGTWCGGYLYLFCKGRDEVRSGFIFTLAESDGGGPAIKHLSTTDILVDDMTVATEGELLFVASSGYCYEWEGALGYKLDATWQSRSYLLANKANFGACMVEASIDDETGITVENLLASAMSDYVEAYSSVNGALGVLPQSETGMSLDGQSYSQAEIVLGREQLVEVTVFADGKEVFTKKVGNREPFCLPSGFHTRTWFVRVRSNVDVRRVALAESMTELYDG